MQVRAKKYLGQHFLTDLGIASRIADTVDQTAERNVLEIGPGMGVLTQFLLEKEKNLQVIEIDGESVEYLKENFSRGLDGRIIEGDFLKFNIDTLFDGASFALIGNYPYNISSQIFFRVLDYRDRIPFVSGMIQKEVARRLASGPGNKDYGILSVLLQAYYDIEYLFTVPPGVFAPPPKVDSAVLSMKRNGVKSLPCDERLFKTVVKTAFNQRRKTLRNSLKPIMKEGMDTTSDLWNRRPEQLSVADFINLTLKFQ